MTRFGAALRTPWVVIALWLVGMLFAWADEAGSQAKFQPPCDAAASPDYAALGELPNVAVWNNRTGLGRDLPAGCIPWNIGQSSVVVAVAGQFHHDGSAEEILARFGAVSVLQTIRYWSVTDGRWEHLVRHATALSGPNSDARRPDFAVEELRNGSALFFLQEENRTSAAIYRMRVTSFSDEHIAVELENITAIRLMLIPMVDRGGFHSVWFLDRLTPTVWGYYSVVGSTSATDFVANNKSAINRAVATFRHVARIPTDQEPPLAP